MLIMLCEITFIEITDDIGTVIAKEVKARMVNNRSIEKIIINGVEDIDWLIDGSSAKKIFYENSEFSMTLNLVDGNVYPDVKVVVDGIYEEANHKKAYVICENMCMEESITKEQYKRTALLKQRVAVLDGTVNLTNGAGTVANINYPTGFTKENCVVITVAVAVQTANVLDFGYHSACYTEVRLNASNISLHCNSTGGGPSGYRNYKIALMRID